MSVGWSCIYFEGHGSFSNLAQEQSALEKSALLSSNSEEKFPTLGENENVSTMKYVCYVLLVVIKRQCFLARKKSRQSVSKFKNPCYAGSSRPPWRETISSGGPAKGVKGLVSHLCKGGFYL